MSKCSIMKNSSMPEPTAMSFLGLLKAMIVILQPSAISCKSKFIFAIWDRSCLERKNGFYYKLYIGRDVTCLL